MIKYLSGVIISDMLVLKISGIVCKGDSVTIQNFRKFRICLNVFALPK